MGNDLPDFQSQVIGVGLEATSFVNGLAADKPALPAAGDIWFARDTKELFLCAVAGSWVSLTPKGTIIMWSGLLADIPTGWALCDGTGGTPNMVNLFVKGVATAATNPGSTGGEVSHTLTEAEMPAHAHQLASYQMGSGGYYGLIAGAGINTTSVGGGTAHENRPPYYEIAYIMKT